MSGASYGKSVEVLQADREKLAREVLAETTHLPDCNVMLTRRPALGKCTCSRNIRAMLTFATRLPALGVDDGVREGIVEGIAVAFSDKAIMLLDVKEDSVLLSRVIDEMRAELRAALAPANKQEGA